MSEIASQIKTLWHKFYSLKFPASCKGKDINGVDLVLLDTLTAGCVHAFIEHGELDYERIGLLRQSVLSLTEISGQLDREGEEYFNLLQQLGHQVLVELDHSISSLEEPSDL